MSSHSFVSYIIVLDGSENGPDLMSLISSLNKKRVALSDDSELIVVMDDRSSSIETTGVNAELGLPTFLVNLGEKANWDTAVLAGLSRANGDITVVIDHSISGIVNNLELLIIEIDQGYEFAVFRSQKISRLEIKRRVFYWILNSALKSKLSVRDTGCIAISRTAINWILQYRINTHFIPELYASKQKKTKYVNLDVKKTRRLSNGNDRNSIAWSTLARRTNFPLQVSNFGMFLLGILGALIGINTLTVEMTGRNLLGQEEVVPPGWTTIVMLMLIGFSIAVISLQVVMRIALSIYRDSGSGPAFVISSTYRLPSKEG